VRWYACKCDRCMLSQGSRKSLHHIHSCRASSSRYRYDSYVRSYPCLRMMCHCITTLGHDVCKIIATNVVTHDGRYRYPYGRDGYGVERPSFHRRWSLRSRMTDNVDYDRALRCDFLHLSECSSCPRIDRIAICNFLLTYMLMKVAQFLGRGSIAYWKLYPIMSRYLGSFYR
jgi:hypothetical protein